MPVIGITGSIASGKSLVSSILQELGACIIDADKIAREIMEPGNKAWSEIKIAFGPQVFHRDGTIDREALAARVFGVPENLKILNDITHPLIINKIAEEIAGYRGDQKGSCPALVVEVPLLFETGMDNMMDTVWTVYIPEELQMKRLIERDKLTIDEARARIASQMPAQEKNRLADQIIDNSGAKSQTAGQVEKLWETYIKSGAEDVEI